MVTLPIRAKIALIVGLAVVIATLLAAAASAVREADRKRSTLINELDAVATVLATAVAPATAAGDRYAALAAIRAMARVPRVVHLRVITPSGSSLAELGDAAVLVQGGEASAGRAVVEVPIVSGGHRVGTLALLADTSDLLRALVDSLIAATCAGLLAALAGLAAAWWLHGVVTRPIHELVTAMDSVRATSNFDVVVAQTSRDETGRLVSAFNDMLGHIRSRDNLLARHRERLEHDVAERTRDLSAARISAETANAAKSKFLATMSHEIRTPMSGMIVMAELLATSELPPRLKRYADTILRSGRSLVAIMNDILDVSKIESGRLVLESVPLALLNLADDTVRLFAERAASKGIELRIEADPYLPAEVMGDPVRFGQILSNLTSNALKFTDRGSVTIRLSTSGTGAGPRDGQPELLVLQIADTGIGIAADKLETIFEAYVQADASTTRHYGGTGIGLSICRQLAELMGGSISVSSTLGKGSTFTVQIPLVPVIGQVSTGSPSSPAAAVTPELCGLRILIADDIAISRDVLAEALARLGASVSAVDDGVAAVDTYSCGTFDVVILDGSMPVMSGYDAARAIREIETNRGKIRTPILALTGHVIGPAADAWREADMDAYLAKPFNVQQLSAAVQSIFSVVQDAPSGRDQYPAPAGHAPEPGTSDCRDLSCVPLVNASEIAGIVDLDGGDTGLLVRLMRLFHELAPEAAMRIETAVERDDLSALVGSAHALRSMAASIGATRLMTLCADIEAAAAGGDLATSRRLAVATPGLITETCSALDGVAAAKVQHAA
ncbi:MAG: response regulator [Hyphomicrobiaceae bacterium]|nr:response regulator [Hyphomicrobiaceae bacterium]